MSCARWLLLLMLLTSSRALAQDPGEATLPDDAAAEHFERGVALFREQAYRAAMVEFQRAYDLSPNYRLLYNLGRAKQQLQDHLGASQSFQAYLVLGGSEIEPERRIQVEETLTWLSGRVARISVTVSRAGAEVFLDDVKVGVAPLGALVHTNVGSHRVSARAADGGEGAQIVHLAGGDLAEVTLTLAEPAPERALAGPTDKPPADGQPWSLQGKLALTGWVVGGAMLATSIATGALALQAQDQLSGQVQTLGVEASAVASQRSRVDTLALTTDVLIGVGAALAVAGTVLWWVSPERSERKVAQPVVSRARLRLAVGPRSLAVTRHF